MDDDPNDGSEFESDDSECDAQAFPPFHPFFTRGQTVLAQIRFELGDLPGVRILDIIVPFGRGRLFLFCAAEHGQFEVSDEPAGNPASISLQIGPSSIRSECSGGTAIVIWLL